MAEARATGNFPPCKLADGSISPAWVAAETRREAVLAAITDEALYARQVAVNYFAGSQLGGELGGPAMNALVEAGKAAYESPAALDAEAKALLVTEAAKPVEERLFQLRKTNTGAKNTRFKAMKRERRRLLAAIADPLERLKRTALYSTAGRLHGGRAGGALGGIASGVARSNELLKNKKVIRDVVKAMLRKKDIRQQLYDSHNHKSVNMVTLGKLLVTYFREEHPVDWWVATETHCAQAKYLNTFLKTKIKPNAMLQPGALFVSDDVKLFELRRSVLSRLKGSFFTRASLSATMEAAAEKMLERAQRRAAAAPEDAAAQALAAQAAPHLSARTEEERKQHKNAVQNEKKKVTKGKERKDAVDDDASDTDQDSEPEAVAAGRRRRRIGVDDDYDGRISDCPSDSDSDAEDDAAGSGSDAEDDAGGSDSD